ncbi:hypothetical protein ASA1KI_03690 [Opitutales bacterium ASA1]|nr:hypothetical protein ASA1KI_03690 [Opitutales bacterium ASA1]
MIAADAASARKKAEDVLLSEGRVQEFIRLTEAREKEARWFVRAEKVSELTWLGRLFWRMPAGFIFYEQES